MHSFLDLKSSIGTSCIPGALSKLSLIPNSFGHDNSYRLQLIFEMHKKPQTSKLEFGLNSKAFYAGCPSLT